MTDRELLQQALDALERGTTGLAIRAIPALRQALAQEQTKCPRCGEVNPAEIHTCSPQVAQPEREWVGLTDEEIVACGWCDLRFARNIEAKLKEKNNG